MIAIAFAELFFPAYFLSGISDVSLFSENDSRTMTSLARFWLSLTLST